MFVPGLSPPSGRSATSCVTKTDPPPDTPRIRGVALRSGTGGHLKREPGAESAKGPRLPTAEGASVSPQGGPEPSQLARFKTHGTGCACGGIFTAASQTFPVRLPAAASFGGSMARPADPAGFQPVCRTISTSDDIASAVGSSAPKDRPFPCRAWQFRHGRASGPKPSGAAFRRMAGRRTQGVGCGHSAPLAAASRAHAPSAAEVMLAVEAPPASARRRGSQDRGPMPAQDPAGPAEFGPRATCRARRPTGRTD